MPRTVDHAQRRGQIVDALLRLADRDGLHAVSLRGVATEAGMSLRLVQYYFHTRAGLMHAAIDELRRRSHERWSRRLGEHAEVPPGSRKYLEAFLDEALPDDPASATFHRLWLSYAALATLDPDLPREPLTDGPGELERILASALAASLPGGDPAFEAARLVNLLHGLGTGVLSGQRTADEARAILSAHLDQTFGGGSAAEREPGA